MLKEIKKIEEERTRKAMYYTELMCKYPIHYDRWVLALIEGEVEFVHIFTDPSDAKQEVNNSKPLFGEKLEIAIESGNLERYIDEIMSHVMNTIEKSIFDGDTLYFLENFEEFIDDGLFQDNWDKYDSFKELQERFNM